MLKFEFALNISLDNIVFIQVLIFRGFSNYALGGGRSDESAAQTAGGRESASFGNPGEIIKSARDLKDLEESKNLGDIKNPLKISKSLDYKAKISEPIHFLNKPNLAKFSETML